MPIYQGNYVSPVWMNGLPPAINDAELLAMSGTIEEAQVLRGSGAPTQYTKGTVGQLYEDTDTGDLYRCDDGTEDNCVWVPWDDNLAPIYDSTATYSKGDYCIHGGTLYRANRNISTAENWTAAHWQQVRLGDDLEAHEKNTSNPHGVTAAQAGAIPTTATLDDISDGTTYVKPTAAQVAQIGTNQTNITAINGKIPSAASSSNQLADKQYVADSITQGTSIFRGSFATKAALLAVQWQTTDPDAANYVSNNDYAVVQDDESQNDECWRYIYVTGTGWTAQYRINESPLTQAQLDALNSGATAQIIGSIADKADNAIVAAVETSSTAVSAHSVGDYLILSGVLYKVTSAISAGGTIAVGVNVTAAVLADEVSAHVKNTSNPHGVTAAQASYSNTVSGLSASTAQAAIDELSTSFNNIDVTVSGASPVVTAVQGHRYLCGTVSTLSFTPSATGICEVIFTSGATAAVLTLPNTVLMPEWWTGCEANQIYDISIVDGVYGAVMAWPVSA